MEQDEDMNKPFNLHLTLINRTRTYSDTENKQKHHTVCPGWLITSHEINHLEESVLFIGLCEPRIGLVSQALEISGLHHSL